MAIAAPQTRRVRHPALGRIVTTIERPPAGAVGRLSACYSGLVSDALGKLAAMHPDIRPMAPGMRLCGPAVTFHGDDWTARKFAIELLQPGDVLVLAAGGCEDYACFGDFSATVARSRGASGVVVDGAIRDLDGIVGLGLPVFARGTTPRNRHYPAGPESCLVNLPVACGGMIVNPGDVVIGDGDGVVVVPREIATDLADQLEGELATEPAKRERLSAPQFSFGVREELERLGYRFS